MCTKKERYINKYPNATASNAKSRQVRAKDRTNGGAFGCKTTDTAFIYPPADYNRYIDLLSEKQEFSANSTNKSPSATASV